MITLTETPEIIKQLLWNKRHIIFLINVSRLNVSRITYDLESKLHFAILNTYAGTGVITESTV